MSKQTLLNKSILTRNLYNKDLRPEDFLVNSKLHDINFNNIKNFKFNTLNKSIILRTKVPLKFEQSPALFRNYVLSILLQKKSLQGLGSGEFGRAH